MVSRESRRRLWWGWEQPRYEASGGSDSDLRAPTLGKVGTVLATQGPLGSGLVVVLSPEKLDPRNRTQHTRVCEGQLEVSRKNSSLSIKGISNFP